MWEAWEREPEIVILWEREREHNKEWKGKIGAMMLLNENANLQGVKLFTKYFSRTRYIAHIKLNLVITSSKGSMLSKQGRQSLIEND